MFDGAVHLDFFPAIVSTPGGEFHKVRVIVAGGHAVVFSSEAGPTVETHVAAPEPNVDMSRGLPWKVQTAEGEWQVSQAQGCGCGNILRSLQREYLLGLAGVGPEQ